MAPPVHITFLGGLGEIGRNCAALELEGQILLIDCGLMFPDNDMLGVDLVLPDFTWLLERSDDIVGCIATHGHEDHVGALPYVLREIGIPPAIYGGRLTIGMVRSKLEEHKLRDVPLRDLSPGTIEEAGPFGIEMVHMSHSIPDACAVAIHTDLGPILLTGDYKFDQTPVDGQPADFARLAELGSEGLLCLCGDSTNADRPGVATSESSVGPALLETFSRAEGRIIVTCFASNVHRVQQVVDAAERLGRKVALVGRSMRKNFNIASNLGLASAPDGILIQPREIEDYPDDEVIAISTGSQGEPLSALRRMAHGDHRDVELHSGDTVVFSATPVPGNERSVNETIDRIFEIGARVITAADAPIHASGHGYQEDMKLMLNLTRPKYVMPMHGDYKRLRLHAGLAEAVGIERERIFQSRNGVPLEITAGNARLGDDVGAGMIFVDGLELGEPDDAALRDRRTLSADGVVIVAVTVSFEDSEIAADPEIAFRGVPFGDDEDSERLLEELADAVEEAVEDALDGKAREPALIRKDVHDVVAKLIDKRLRRRPMVLPVVVEV